MSSDGGPTLFHMAKAPTRIDLLELDIDLRLADLWREAAEVSEWNLEVMAAFMRAAYGKGYCDALTEDDPGSLCHDHGYRIPARRETRAPFGLADATIRAWLGSAIRRGSSSRSRWRRCSQSSCSTPRSRAAARPRSRPSELGGQKGVVSLAGRVQPGYKGDSYGDGLRFRLRDIKGGSTKTVTVVYTGSVSDQFRAGREVSVKGQLRNGTFVAVKDSLVTKCPSKYTAKKDT